MRLGNKPYKRRIRVHMKDETTVEGLLMQKTGGFYRVSAVSVLGAERETRLAGDIWVPAGNVRMIEAVA